MKDFLEVVTASKALKLIRSFPVTPVAEMTPIEEAWGRILAEDMTAKEPIPHFSRSLVDGFAVLAKDTVGAKDHNPVPLRFQGEVRVAEEPSVRLREGGTIYVSTGSMIPEGSDAVLMQEHARRSDDLVEVTRTLRKGENIFSRGEDISPDTRVLERGRRLTFADVGVLAALGTTHLSVFQKPLCAVISSGDEVVPVMEHPPLGKVRDINRYTLSAVLERYGGKARFAGLAKDSRDEVHASLHASRGADMILVSGGSSKGERDFITDAIGDLGGHIHFHGVNIKPGKPTIFGEIWGKPVFGLPGHPMSCLMAALRFVVPLLHRLAGAVEGGDPGTVSALLSTNVPSSPGIEEYVGVTLGNRKGKPLATPVFTRSAAISSLARAEGYIIVPADKEGLEKGDETEVHFFG
jgi:molybdopterin molybdotransferase